MALTGLREGLARAKEARGPECRPRRPLPAERGERAVGLLQGGPPPSGRGARAPPEVKIPKPLQRVAVGAATRRDTPRPVLRASEGRRWRGAVDKLPKRVRIADAPPGESGPGEGGVTGDTAPKDPEAGGRAKVVRWARRRLLFRVHQKNQGPTEQHSGGKMVFRIGLESEGAANDPHTYPIKNSHQNILD